MYWRSLGTASSSGLNTLGNDAFARRPLQRFDSLLPILPILVATLTRGPVCSILRVQVPLLAEES